MAALWGIFYCLWFEEGKSGRGWVSLTARPLSNAQQSCTSITDQI